MATITSNQVPNAWAPDITTAVYDAAATVPNALIFAATQVAGEVRGDAPYVRVPWVSDGAAQQIAEGDCLSCDDGPELNEIIFRTHKFGACIKLSFEQATGVHGTAALGASIRRSLERAVNWAFLRSDGDPQGILNTPGLLDVGLIGGDLDGITNAIAAIAGAGGSADLILVSPSTWAALATLKTGDGSNLPLLGNGGEPALYGVPLVVDSAMPDGQGLIIDRSAVVSAVGQIRARSEENAECDSTGLFVFWRVGWQIAWPNRIAKFTIATTPVKATKRRTAPSVVSTADEGGILAETVLDDGGPFTKAKAA